MDPVSSNHNCSYEYKLRGKQPREWINIYLNRCLWGIANNLCNLLAVLLGALMQSDMIQYNFAINNNNMLQCWTGLQCIHRYFYNFGHYISIHGRAKVVERAFSGIIARLTYCKGTNSWHICVGLLYTAQLYLKKVASECVEDAKVCMYKLDR